MLAASDSTEPRTSSFEAVCSLPPETIRVAVSSTVLASSALSRRLCIAPPALASASSRVKARFPFRVAARLLLAMALLLRFGNHLRQVDQHQEALPHLGDALHHSVGLLGDDGRRWLEVALRDLEDLARAVDQQTDRAFSRSEE